MLAKNCADCCDKTDQHERHGHGDEHGQCTVGVLQKFQVYFSHVAFVLPAYSCTVCLKFPG